ncbi:LytR family transcriptional regulator [Paraclostridium bifermentans]|uniref:LCP family protein n=1 Tax=Paraclostridium bifermentans TaxID=1490 RepID=UPI000A174983|nr:LCP family protein [Paraclostridium bifermentans]OSB10939.1 LytR family transcriptional regulator [Paraclostridium bifermentans]
MSIFKKFFIFIIIILILLPVSIFGYIHSKINKVYDPSSSIKSLKETNYASKKGITNILLVGTDARNTEEKSRSDAMMILTVDNNHKNLKLTSLARDTYVEIPGHGKQKLTHAYAYGGLNLLLETLESNFKIDIQNYVVVNFFSFINIIDTLNGIVVDVKPNEIKELNRYIPECYSFDQNKNKNPMKNIEYSGKQKLNGYQTLAYSRIRYNDSALERDNRQRLVLESAFEKAKHLPINKYPDLIDSILPYIKTNMNTSDILSIGNSILSIGNFNIKTLEFPIEEYSTGGIYKNAGWVWRYDKEKCLPILHDFIFNDKVYKK